MHCPFCNADETKVIDSRLVGDEGREVRRRRECPKCLERFTTYEKIELSLARIIKSDGTRTNFDEDKLRAGLLKALEKRPVSTEQVDSAVSNIISRLRSCSEREVNARLIGEWVMDELRVLDEVAYVRFASVYRSFQDVNAFHEEITRLQTHQQESQKK